MPGRVWWACALWLVALTGCPEEFGKHGRIQRAAHKDVMERIQPRCDEERYKAICKGGKEQSPECIKECGG